MKQAILGALEAKDRDLSRLATWLTSGSFFNEPASYKYHGNFPGGLAAHCFAMSARLEYFCRKLPPTKDQCLFDPIVVALCHDLDKVGKYEIDSRNVKKNGTWEAVKYYKYTQKNRFYSGGEIAAGLAARLVPDLSPLEHLAIRWVEGMYAVDNNSDLLRAYNAAVEVDPRIILAHTADMLSSRFDEPTLDDFQMSDRINMWGGA